MKHIECPLKLPTNLISGCCGLDLGLVASNLNLMVGGDGGGGEETPTPHPPPQPTLPTNYSIFPLEWAALLYYQLFHFILLTCLPRSVVPCIISLFLLSSSTSLVIHYSPFSSLLYISHFGQVFTY